MKSSSVTIQLKASEQNLAVLMFIMLYKLVLTFESVDGCLKCARMVLFVMLHKLVLDFECVDRILNGDHSKENY